ncbi:MAG: hypothetical protein IJ400_00220 [Clostridia bacterium]|nr:hypothetical protein [Clostridia bacterium]
MNETIYTSLTRSDYIVYNNRIALGNVIIPRSAIVKLVWVEPDKSFPGMLQIFTGNLDPISVQVLYNSRQDFIDFKKAIESILI